MRPSLVLGVTLTAGWCALSLSTSCAEGNDALLSPLSSAAPTDSAPSASVSALAGAGGFGGMDGSGGFGGMLGTAGAGGGMGGSSGGEAGGFGEMDGSVGGMPPQGPEFAEVHEIFTARCSGGNCHSAGDQGPSRARFASGDLAEAEAEATGLAKGSMLGEPVPEEMVRRINLEKGMADFMPAGPAGMKLPPVEIDLIERWAAAQ